MKRVYFKLFTSFENQSSDRRGGAATSNSDNEISRSFGTRIPFRRFRREPGTASRTRRALKTPRTKVCTNWYGRARTRAHTHTVRDEIGERQSEEQGWTCTERDERYILKTVRSSEARWKPIGPRTEVKFQARATRRLVKMLLGVLGRGTLLG